MLSLFEVGDQNGSGFRFLITWYCVVVAEDKKLYADIVLGSVGLLFGEANNLRGFAFAWFAESLLVYVLNI